MAVSLQKREMWTQRQICRWKTIWRRHTRRRQPCDWSDVPTSQEKPKTAGNIRGGKEGFCPRAVGESTALWTSWSQTSGPQSCKRMNFSYSTTQLLVLCLGRQEESAGWRYLWGETLRLILRVWKQLEAGTTTCSCGAGTPFLAWGWQRQRANPNHVLFPPAFQSPFSFHCSLANVHVIGGQLSWRNVVCWTPASQSWLWRVDGELRDESLTTSMGHESLGGKHSHGFIFIVLSLRSSISFPYEYRPKING